MGMGLGSGDLGLQVRLWESKRGFFCLAGPVLNMYEKRKEEKLSPSFLIREMCFALGFRTGFFFLLLSNLPIYMG
jgi:hypothetical protein